MLSYARTRLLLTVPVLMGVSVLTFMILHLIPGDPAQLLLGDMGGGSASGDVSDAAYENLRRELGLNDPLPVQYANYVADAVRLDFGRSFQTNRPVSHSIREVLPYTLQLTVVGLGLAIVIGGVLGVVAALHRNSWIDNATMALSLVGLAMPSFWLGFILIQIFALRFGWLPSTGTGGFSSVVLPAATLGLVASGVIARLVRSTMLEVLRQEYVVTARAKGLRNRVVILRHALRNALIPVVTIVGLQFGALLSGAVIIETVFARRGLGRLAVEAILRRDYPMVQGTILVAAVGYVVVNLAVDLSYAWLDPRIKYG
ncbi:MAG: ABC transporter, permease protein 1 (cluster 5, nickel/peptides/opines) [uncultured Thermomicrobiales bacterium]|uniref:ABC transporter, permease protein 1 (Cluster 5, nickel/peptides/opines) n=1 Tax=uncultured Thermomicrobiales bacterium TaxID=1645740 RepID=A0A6J4URC5_9BACT|nr:MAG: ABC transporter, permease protein 1 (cluster 5, nickel/peptides/opines) [uncultured Thermomicrobiales bacterium]